MHIFQNQYLDDKVLKVAALKRAQKVVLLTNTDDQLAMAAFISEVMTDREKNASKAIALMPRKTPVNFTGENARAF